MSHTELIRSPLVAQAAAVANREVSARALLEAHLTQIDARQPAVNAFRAVAADSARHAADHADALLAAGQGPRGRLFGVPVAIKDQICTRGLVTSAGSKMLENWRPPYDATAVSRLVAEGAIIIGKTNQDEFAMGSTSATCAFGAVHHPWDLDRAPGGSSGGSAAAVADFQAAGALGTDTGGSIRQPASHCGLVGIKPTWGRVSRHGAIAYASSLDQIGPLARTVADAALMLEVIAGRDMNDMGSLDAPVPAYSALAAAAAADPDALKGLRVGVPTELMGEGNAPAVKAAIEAAHARFEALGAILVPVSLPHTSFAIQTYYLIAMAEASSNLARYDGLRYGHRAEGARDLEDLIARSRSEGLGPEVKRRILLGTFALSAGYYDAFYGKAQAVRALIRRDFEAAYATCDIIASPTSPVTAPRLDVRQDDPLAIYLMDIDTVMSNLAGHPSLSMPVALDDDGLPIGLQLMGPHLGEETIIRAAAAYEARHPFAGRALEGRA